MKDRKNKKTGIKIAGCIGIIIVLAAAVILVKRYAPSNTVLPLSELYPVGEGEVLVVLQDEVTETRGKLENEQIYLEMNQITTSLNKGFYWDSHENLLIYTTASSLVKAEPGEQSYYVNKNKKKMDYEIVKLDGDSVYIALDFVKKYTDLDYQLYEEPARVVITYKYGQELLYTTAKKSTPIRRKAGIKSEIIATAEKGSVLQCLDEGAEAVNGFLHVITQDGVSGYISEKKTEEPHSTVLASNNEFSEESYEHVLKDYKINMVWHQVYNQDANNQLSSLLENTEGVNTIAPTWFRIEDEEGNISSLASESYVSKAHSMGIEVWALITDVDNSVDMDEVLSYTSRREKIEKELVAQAIRYDFDGINIDFETISRDGAASYLQFIRELSIKCRNNGIVLSIDNYVPTEYTAYYDRAEQARVADYIVTMAYDEHYAGGGESGSVASIGYVEEAIEKSLAQVPAEQLLLGIPFYTRLWKETKEEDGTVLVTAESYGMKNSWNKIKEMGITPEWDEETGQYYAEYEDGDAVYKIWLEDETSIGEKVERAYENSLAGTAAWKLGMEKGEVWEVIKKYMNYRIQKETTYE